MRDVIGLDSRENILLRRSNSAAMMVATRLFYSGAATPALIFLAELSAKFGAELVFLVI
jgi:hypothetical protein